MAVTAPFVHSHPHVDALAEALGIRDRALAHVMSSFGLDATCTPLVTWIPAIELAWHRRLTRQDQERLLRLVFERHGILGTRAELLLYEWLTRRPSEALFRTGRRTLRAQLVALPAHERPALRARVIGPCAELADLSGGLRGSVASDQEHVWLLALADDLRTPDERCDFPHGAWS